MLFDGREHYYYRYQTFFMGNFYENGDTWTYYKVYDGEFPSHEDLLSLQAIVFPGSHISVYDTKVPFNEEYRKFAQKVYYEYPHIKMVGICFGH